MNKNIKFTEQELEAMYSNHKIKAIKLVRESQSLGLKEAKHVVEDYMNQNPHLIQQHKSTGGLGFLVFLLFLVAIVLYFVFNKSVSFT